MDDSLPAPAPAGSALHQMKAIIPKSSTRDWNTITTIAMLHSAGSATAKGRTTKEFRVARLKMRMRVCSVGMVHSRPEKEFQRRGPAQEKDEQREKMGEHGPSGRHDLRLGARDQEHDDGEQRNREPSRLTRTPQRAGTASAPFRPENEWALTAVADWASIFR